MYKPIVIKGFLSEKWLHNGGEKETNFLGRKATDPLNQWVMYPLENGRVCLKSVADNYNLGIHVAAEVGWAFVSSNEQVIHTPMQQFEIERLDDSCLSFALKNEGSQKFMGCKETGHCCTTMGDAMKNEHFFYEPMFVKDL
jgi:hypothetical protein